MYRNPPRRRGLCDVQNCTQTSLIGPILSVHYFFINCQASIARHKFVPKDTVCYSRCQNMLTAYQIPNTELFGMYNSSVLHILVINYQ